MKKLIPIGISDYKQLRNQNCYYVDKTLLIKDIHASGQVVLATRPRRFGKTLNLSMLRYFYEISDDTNDQLFIDTAIWALPEYRRLQRAFPVIFISLRTVTQSTFAAMFEQFSYIISIEFKRHAYLLESDNLDRDEKDAFMRISAGKVSEVELGNSLEFLARMLNKHHKKNVIVLIDEYDVPAQYAYIHKFYDTLIAFLRTLLTGPLKDQNILEKGVVTGNLTLAKAGIFTGLNNLDVFNLTRSTLADKFGFTTQEMEELLRYYGCEDKRQGIQDWYNGYRFGETSGIFNPWSVLKCVSNNCSLETYWANTSDNVLLKDLIGSASSSIKTDLELLMQGKSVRHVVEESIIFPDLPKENNLVWSLLLFTGYLTYTEYTLKEGKKECALIIPNQEIKYLYTELITKIFGESVMGGQAVNLLQAMLEANTEVFSALLQSFVLNSMSTFHVSEDEPEKSYHLFVLGMLVSLRDNYQVNSERESGLGRYDIMITPKNKYKQAIIIEFKKVWQGSKDTVEIASQKALDQIRQKKYSQELHGRGFSNIIAYGIAFEKKNIHISCMRIENGKEIECEALS